MIPSRHARTKHYYMEVQNIENSRETLVCRWIRKRFIVTTARWHYINRTWPDSGRHDTSHEKALNIYTGWRQHIPYKILRHKKWKIQISMLQKLTKLDDTYSNGNHENFRDISIRPGKTVVMFGLFEVLTDYSWNTTLRTEHRLWARGTAMTKIILRKQFLVYCLILQKKLINKFPKYSLEFD